MDAIGLSLSTFTRMPYPDLAQLAREAEDDGFSGVFVPEVNNDAMMCCYSIARATRRITVGTRIINVYLRTPMLCGAGAMMLQEESQGRFLLGLGVSHRETLKPLGIEMVNAREFLGDYTRLLMRVLTGEPIPGFPYQFRVAQPRVPVYFAALTLETARLGGTLADGLMLYMCSPDRMARMIDAARKSAHDAGRPGSAVKILMGLPIFLDDDLKAAFAVARRDLAFYAGLPFYNRIWVREGFAREAAAALEATRRNDRAAVSAAITDPMIELVALAGPISRCRDRLEEYRRRGADLPILVVHTVRDDYQTAVRRVIKAFSALN
jgi:alkanesulfonate monooxygenase SsuD/methylene tetrahydromethanopterin reductase-like flavin-dependent oxidoreductase (luciferase family)